VGVTSQDSWKHIHRFKTIRGNRTQNVKHY
jgi:hypothetical protein